MNVDDVTEVKPLAEKTIIAPVIGDWLEADNPEKVANPLTAETEVVPPKLQLPLVVSAVAVTDKELVVTIFPYLSVIFTFGCVAKIAPFVAGAVGCVLITNFAGNPTPIDWEKVLLG